MNLKKIIGTGAIAGALGFSAIGLASAANAAPQEAPAAVPHVQLDGWHGGGGGWHGDGGGWHGDRGWRDGGGRGWGGPGYWGGPPPPCPFGMCF